MVKQVQYMVKQVQYMVKQVQHMVKQAAACIRCISSVFESQQSAFAQVCGEGEVQYLPLITRKWGFRVDSIM